MIECRGFNYCSDCESGAKHSHLRSIGEKVKVPGNSWSEYTFYQCPRCGHVWQHIEDGGFGGHGSHYSRLTKP